MIESGTTANDLAKGTIAVERQGTPSQVDSHHASISSTPPTTPDVTPEKNKKRTLIDADLDTIAVNDKKNSQ